MADSDLDQDDKPLRNVHLGNYVPFSMWVTLVLFAALIAWMWSDIVLRFMAHPELNGLIIGTFFAALAKVFIGIYKVQSAARFLDEIDQIASSPDTTPEDVQAAHQDLRRKGRFIDTFYFRTAVLNIERINTLEFTDNEARIIKSKVGNRAAHMRDNIMYWSGVLVMLGLIGTFWGLLETINAVGESMGSIVASFAGSAGGDTNSAMLDFLKSISKPLQGMGIAFSASLFGLGGSLVVGLMNAFAGKGVNKFIEDFGLWMDDRIPATRKEARASYAPGSQQEMLSSIGSVTQEAIHNELNNAQKRVLGTVFQLSASNIGKLTDIATQIGSLTKLQKKCIDDMMSERKTIASLIISQQETMSLVKSSLKDLTQAVTPLLVVSKDILREIRYSSAAVVDGQKAFVANQDLLTEQLVEVNKHQADFSQTLHVVAAAAESINKSQELIVEAINGSSRTSETGHAHITTLTQATNDLLQTVNATYLRLMSLEFGSGIQTQDTPDSKTANG